jgi:hypothetical protein
MKRPIVVRPLSGAERRHLEAGVRSSEAFVLRRGQILLARARGEGALPIAHHLGGDDQTGRHAVHAFNRSGLDGLNKGSSRPPTVRAAFPGARAQRLRALRHQSPRGFGQPTSLWTLALAAEVSVEQALTPARVSGATLRATLARLGVRRQRAKAWMTRPDPGYARTRGPGTG